MGQAHDRYSVRRGRNREPTPEEQGKDPAAAAMGSKGGKARAANLPASKRAEVARKAAKKRWAHKITHN